MPDGIVKFDSGESSEMKSIHPRPQAFHMCREANPLGGRSNISQIQRIYFAKKAIVMTTMAFFWRNGWDSNPRCRKAQLISS